MILWNTSNSNLLIIATYILTSEFNHIPHTNSTVAFPPKVAIATSVGPTKTVAMVVVNGDEGKETNCTDWMLRNVCRVFSRLM